MSSKKMLQIILPGRLDYPEALQLQKDLFSKRRDNLIEDTLILLEHPPVITMGKRGKDDHIYLPEGLLKEKGITVHRIERGGDVTYHGPGQIVGYPIMDLNNHGRDIRLFVRNIEEVFICLLKDKYRITAGRDPEHTGVWVDDSKITAIGLSIKRWVSMHGFAFNVNTNMEHFNWIMPCGISDKGVTSLQKLLGHQLALDEVMNQLVEYFSRVFSVETYLKGEWR